MSSSRSSSRYSNRSSTQSDPSSSADLTQTKTRGDVSSYALARSKSTKNNDQNLSAMVKKFMEKRSTKPKTREFVVAADVIADDFRKKAGIRGGTTGFGGLHKKLFGSKGKNDEKKALASLSDVKPNARTLAMVLRSERELLSQNKDKETEIIELKLLLEEKNREVDKLKDLCLKQREEIKALKNAILFPDVMLQPKQEADSQVTLKQAKQIIPSLQRQVTSLTGQLHSLAQDLAEVKADKYSVMGCYDNDSLVSSPRTPTHEQEEATNSLELSYTTPGSPDDMFLNDLNPCLTPYAISKSKSKEFENYLSSAYNNNNTTRGHEIGFESHGGRKLSKSSTREQHVNSAKNLSRKSDENNKYAYRGW
ncbi:hypothetical protein HanRHA438_Chr15g0691381 [Helianthus annuus]|nr:hypothetical protein HanRHA438_Chr15g0691381 [Helianthus annuus]